jgi:hypothetical protein
MHAYICTYILGGRDYETGLQIIHEIKNNEVELKSLRNSNIDAVSMKNHHTEKWKCASGVV